jgi:hypothetical protein
MTHDERPFGATALRLSAGVIVWAAHFATIYGYTGLACARQFHDAGAVWLAGVPWVIGVATLIAVAIMLWLMAPLVRRERTGDFVVWMSGAIAGLALIGIVYEAVPVFMLPVCA